jgi:hypothetical protein
MEFPGLMCSTPVSAEHQVVWEVVWNRSYDRLTIEREKGFEGARGIMRRHSMRKLSAG